MPESTTTPVPHGLPMERDVSPFDPPSQITRLRETRPVSPLVFPDGHKGWLVTGYDAVRQLMAPRHEDQLGEVGGRMGPGSPPWVGRGLFFVATMANAASSGPPGQGVQAGCDVP